MWRKFKWPTLKMVQGCPSQSQPKPYSSKAIRLVTAVEKTAGNDIVILGDSLEAIPTLLISGLSRIVSMPFSFRHAISFLIRFTIH